MRAFLSLIKNKKTTFIASLLIAAVGLFASGGMAMHKVSADCSNDIMCGGFSSPSNFISKVNGSSELQHIYADGDYGLSHSMYDDFKAHARAGYTTSSGNIYLSNGTKVGTDATSIGRLASYQGSGYFTKTIDGHHYYGNTNDKAFARGTSRLDVTILLDSNGTAQFVVINSCGNPVHFRAIPPPPPPPAPKPQTYACVRLVGAILDKSTNTYTLTATGSYANGATPVSADFNFGDGKTQNGVKLSGTTVAVSHGYPNLNKSYAASTTLHFIANGKPVSATSKACQTIVPVTVPYCQVLAGVIIDANKYEAQFTATAVLNGRTLTSADFDFGDGKTQNGVKPNGPTTVLVTHDYAAGGTYNATATLHFSLSGHTYTAPTCRALVKPTTIVSECKPNVPMGSPECTPCQYDSSLPSDSPKCTPPCTTGTDTTTGDTNTCALPNTGAGNTIAIFSAVVVGGFLIYRQVMYRQHKAAFVAAEQGTSALPLADPSSDTPLRDTPLEPTRSTFRRRRPF